MRCLLFLFGYVLPFALALLTNSQQRTLSFGVSRTHQAPRFQKITIFSSNEGEPEASSSPKDEGTDEVQTTAVSTTTTTTTPVPEEEESKYPINLPSPILLSASMILGIAGTGSSFELAGGSPTLGFGTSAAIAAVSIPLSLFLFYASILKATAETEADDEEYMKGRY